MSRRVRISHRQIARHVCQGFGSLHLGILYVEQLRPFIVYDE